MGQQMRESCQSRLQGSTIIILSVVCSGAFSVGLLVDKVRDSLIYNDAYKQHVRTFIKWRSVEYSLRSLCLWRNFVGGYIFVECILPFDCGWRCRSIPTIIKIIAILIMPTTTITIDNPEEWSVSFLEGVCGFSRKDGITTRRGSSISGRSCSCAESILSGMCVWITMHAHARTYVSVFIDEFVCISDIDEFVCISDFWSFSISTHSKNRNLYYFDVSEQKSADTLVVSVHKKSGEVCLGTIFSHVRVVS